SSAGNSGADSYESVFRPSGQIIGDFGEAHDFDPGDGVDIFQAVAVPPGAQLTATLQWDSPFFSVSGDPGSPNDVDILFVLDGTIVGGSATNNVAGDAVEVGSFTNSSQSFVRVDVVITLFAGPPPGLIKYVINRAGVIEEFDTNSSTIYGHANAEGASAVGAVAYFETPEFGVSPPVLEAFSSVGRTPILFDLDGEAINVSRQKPEFSCVDGTNTTFFGQDVEPDGFPNFFGTSAAAPHAAAIAALLLDLDPTLSAQDLEDAIVSTAIDMPPAGIDDQSGAGLCDALDAVRSVADAGLTLTVSPSLTAVAEPGREVTFTVRVNNTGNTPVTLVELNDSVSGSLTDRCALPQTVSGGATLTCAYAQEVFGNGGETQESTVSAGGETPLGEVSAAGTATVDITDVLPALRVEKSVFPSRVPEPGWRPEYTVRVQNLTSE
ncbi:MAG: S8 family serine peptidase, partial [Myxococcota bacterium]